MTIDHKCIEHHEKHLAKVSRTVLKERLHVFRLKEEVMEVRPFICVSLNIEPAFTDYNEWLHPLDPISLNDLKNWFGIPNETAKHMLKLNKTQALPVLCAGDTHALPPALPMMQHYEFKSLDHEQKLAVQQTANSLLYGYVDSEMVLRAPLSGVINYMIAAARDLKLKIFVAPDLIVCPDNVVKFKGIPALFFNNILIYGNGQIVTKSKTKIHAFQINHVDA